MKNILKNQTAERKKTEVKPSLGTHRSFAQHKHNEQKDNAHTVKRIREPDKPDVIKEVIMKGL